MKANQLNHNTTLDTQKSDTTDQIYTIGWSQATGYTCDCIGYSARRKCCKHILRFMFKSRADSLLTESIDYLGRKATIEQLLQIAKEIWKGKV